MKSARAGERHSAQRGSSTIATFLAAIIALLAATFGLHQVATTAAPVAIASQPAAAAQTTTQQFQDLSNDQNAASSASSQEQQQQGAGPTGPAPQTTSSPPTIIHQTIVQEGNDDQLSAKVNALATIVNNLASLIPTNTPSQSETIPQYIAAGGNPQAPFAAAQAIDQLSGVTIFNSTIDTASISDLSGKYLSLNGGTLTGAFQDTSAATSTLAGALGIGTTSPNYLLDVTSPTAPLAEFTDGEGDSVLVSPAGGNLLEMHATWATGLAMYVNNNNANGAPGVDMYKSRGTGSAPSAVQWCGSYECGDYLGYINFGGYDGSSYSLGAAIYASADENWTPTSHESHLAIYFTPTGHTTQDEMVQFGGRDASGVNGTNALFFWPVNFYSNSATGVHLSADQNGGLDMARGDGSAGAVFSVNGNIGIGTTSPWGQLAISLNNGSVPSGNNAFIIASSTASATTTLFDVTNSGNVGIGTASPTSTLDVRAGSEALQIGAGPVATGINLVRSNSGLRYNGFTLGSLNWGGTADNYASEQAGASILSHTEGNGSFTWQSAPVADLSFWTTPNVSGAGELPRLFIDANGNIGIGTLAIDTPPAAKLYLDADNGDTNTNVFVVASSTASATTTLFDVTNSGAASLAGSLTQNSDQRLKTNIQSLDGSSSLAAIDALNPVSFDWINGIFGDGDQLGFIAQAVQTVFPQLVSTTSPTALTPDGTLGLNYSGLIAPIIASIQGIAHITGAFETNLIAWLGNTSNGIQDLFANNIYATNITTNVVNSQQDNTQELCVGDGANDPSPVCVTKSQLAAILTAAGTPNSPGSVTSSPGDANPESVTSGGAGDSAAVDTPPIMQINGDNPATITTGTTYTDLGATITGPQQDLNLGIEVIVDGGATTTPDQIQIDTTEPGTHTILYSATDQNGLEGTAIRTVVVSAPAQSDVAASTTDAATNPGEGDSITASTTAAASTSQ